MFRAMDEEGSKIETSETTGSRTYRGRLAGDDKGDWLVTETSDRPEEDRIERDRKRRN